MQYQWLLEAAAGLAWDSLSCHLPHAGVLGGWRRGSGWRSWFWTGVPLLVERAWLQGQVHWILGVIRH